MERGWGVRIVVFTGTFEHSVDAKHRLAIPSEIRGLLQREAVARGQAGPPALYVTLGESQCLAVYAQWDFEQRAAELDRSELEAGELLEYERILFSLAGRVELDAAGRIRLPEHLLKMAQLGSDVVLIGVKDHLEIRDRAAWQAHVQQILASRPQLLMNPRRAMRRPPGSDDAATRPT